MEEFIKLFRNVLAPEADWPKFIRKVLGFTLCVSVGAYGWKLYDTSNIKGEQPVQTVLARSDSRERQVRGLLESLLRADPNIKSIWVYSWPDARQIVPVMYVGNSSNPLPEGSFVRGDEEALGTFLFGDCYQLARGFSNTTCPINGFEDSWGVIVVHYGEGVSQEHIRSRAGIIDASARRTGLILYSNADHIGNFRD